MLLIASIVLALGVMVNAQSSSSCFSYVSSVPVPSSLESLLSSAESSVPSLTSIGSVVSTFELDSPSLATVETVIESYISSYYTLVDEIESIYAYSSLYTSQTVSELTLAYSTLASAISELYSAEATQSSLAAYQSTLQSLEVYYSTILTALSSYTYYASPSLYAASNIISEATLTSPSIFASVIAVSTAVSTSLTVSSAVSYLSYELYVVPTTVANEVLTIIQSPSTVSQSTLASLESCYSTLLSELTYVEAFTASHQSIVSDLVNYLSAASSVASLGSAVQTIISNQMSTLAYELSVLSAAAQTESDLSVYLSLLSYLTAESPSLAQAESTVEASFYFSPSIAYSIYYALDYPSLITNPSAVHNYEESHESLVDAIETLLNFEVYYLSSASLLTAIDSELTTAFVSYGTLLTAYSFVADVTSPSAASANVAISAAKDTVSDLTDVLSALYYAAVYSPTLSCAESVIEYYAVVYPLEAQELWSVYDGNSAVSASSVSYIQSLVASYTSLASALSVILSDASASSYPISVTLVSTFLEAAESDSSLLSQYASLASGSASAYSSFTFYSSYSYSSSGSY